MTKAFRPPFSNQRDFHHDRRSPRYTAELADCILQALARGRALSDICAKPGMPCENTVRQWMADDIEGFAAR
jgi:hypothetical protein